MHDRAIDFRSMLRPKEPEQESDSDLPPLGDGKYQPYAQVANKPLYSIHFVSKTSEVRSFQYVHLDSNSSYAAESITLRFMGMEPTRVVIHGRNLYGASTTTFISTECRGSRNREISQRMVSQLL